MWEKERKGINTIKSLDGPFAKDCPPLKYLPTKEGN
jgi:hypothetical protein